MRGIYFLTRQLFLRALLYALGALIPGLHRGVNEVLARQRCYASLNVTCRRFGTTCPFHLQESSSAKKIIRLLDSCNGIGRLSRNVDNWLPISAA